MASNYPGAVDSFSNPSQSSDMDDSGVEHDVQHANANDAVEAIEAELGTDPAGSYTTVKDRLDSVSWSAAAYWPSGTWLTLSRGSALNNTGYQTSNHQYVLMSPFVLSESVTVDRVALFPATSSSPNSVGRLGLYGSLESGMPGTLITTFGEVDLSTSGAKVLTVSQALTAQTMYWAAVHLYVASSLNMYIVGEKNWWAAIAPNNITQPSSSLRSSLAYTYADGLPSSIPANSWGAGSLFPVLSMRRT